MGSSLEIASNFQPQKFGVNLRLHGLQPSIFVVISANGEPKSARNVGASAPIMSSSAIDRLKTRAIYERPVSAKLTKRVG
jgi:hypothetical protein